MALLPRTFGGFGGEQDFFAPFFGGDPFGMDLTRALMAPTETSGQLSLATRGMPLDLVSAGFDHGWLAQRSEAGTRLGGGAAAGAVAAQALSGTLQHPLPCLPRSLA